MTKISSLVSETYNKILTLDFSAMASEMAFNITFALFPFIIFLISILGMIGSEELVVKIINILSVVMPNDLTNIFDRFLTTIIESSNFSLVTIGFVISLWSASNATNIMLKVINKVYEDTDDRTWFKNRGIAILMVILIAIIIVISANLIIFGRVIFEFIINFVNIPLETKEIIMLIRWPITFITLFIMSMVIYYFSPNVKSSIIKKLISSIPGALFFCIFWLLGSWLFSIYVENFGSYNQTFGFLGGIMIMLTWLYFSSFIILTGGVINSVFYGKMKPQKNQ